MIDELEQTANLPFDDGGRIPQPPKERLSKAKDFVLVNALPIIGICLAVAV